MTISRNRLWLLGAVLFLSFAANFLLGGMLMGRNSVIMPPLSPPAHFRHRDPLQWMLHAITELPPAEQAQARIIIETYRPELEKHIAALKTGRKEAMSYIKSEAYQRDQAQTRLLALQEHNLAMQSLAQEMMLDLADHLSPAQRLLVFKRPTPSAPATPPPHGKP